LSYLPTLLVFPGVSKFFINSPSDFWGLFLHFVFNDILKMQRFLDISRFLYSGGWQVQYRSELNGHQTRVCNAKG